MLQYFTVKTTDSGGQNEINYYSTGSVKTSIRGQFTSSSSVSISQNPTISATNAEYTFQLIGANPLPQGSYYVITFPYPDIKVPGALTATCTTNPIPVITAALVPGTSNQVKVSNVFGSGTTYNKAGVPVQIAIKGWTNPSTVDKYYFTVVSYENTDNNVNDIDEITTLYITPSAATLTVQSVLPQSSTRIYDTATYTLTITGSTAALPSNGVLTIVFPSDFSIISNSTCQLSSFKGFNQGSWSCVPFSSNRTIIIKLGRAIPANTQYSFDFTCVRNPGTFSQVGPITVSQLTSTFGLQCSGTYYVKSNTFTYNYINSFSVTSSNYNAGQYATLYYFTFTPKAKVPQGSSFTITLPSDLQITNSYNVASSCGGTTSGLNTNRNLYCNFNSGLTKLTVQYGYYSGDSSADPPTISFSINYVKNPRSTAPTSPFNVSISDSNNKLLYSWIQTTTPSIQMTAATTPTKITLNRLSLQNGALDTYSFTIINNNYYIDNDLMIFEAPNYVEFTKNSICIGVAVVQADLSCQISSDYKSVTITIIQASSRRFLASAGKINSNNLIIINVTNVVNPPTTRPGSSSFKYYVKTSDGYSVETQTSDILVTNTYPGVINYKNAEVRPQNYFFNSYVDYVVSFVPTNYEQNMYILLTIPTQLQFPSNGQISCASLVGISSSLSCSVNLTSRVINITNGFSDQQTIPSLIQFSLSNLKNPSSKLETDSFILQTYTASDSYYIDKLDTHLTVNFICNYPCKTCDITSNSYCFSCYTSDLYRYFYNNTCLEICPNETYADQSNTSCNACTSPCLYCENTTNTCTKCISGYILNGTKCIQTIDTSTNKLSLNFVYPWPFVICSFILTLIILILILCKKETKFRESAIAFIAWPEFLSWAALIFLSYQNNGLSLNLYLLLLGSAVQLLINIIYGLIHQKVIVHKADDEYRNFLQDNHKCSVFIILISFIFTFKFHQLIISFLGNSDKLKGEFNLSAWRIWNTFALISIVFSYFPIGGSCVLFLLNNKISSTLSYLNLEVLIISSYMALLLLVGIIRNCCTCCKFDKRKKKLGNREEKYNDLKNDSISIIQDQSTKKDQIVLEDEEEESLSAINRSKTKNKRRELIYSQQQEDEDDVDMIRSRRNNKETEPLTAQDKRMEQKYLDEMEKLSKLTEMLRTQQELHNYEKKLILQERERVLREKDEKFKELEDLKNQLREERQSIMQERTKLTEQRNEFLDEVDKRVKQRIEDWEMQSMRSMLTAQKHHIPQNEMSVQTQKRMNEVNFNVDVGFESDAQLRNRMFSEQIESTKDKKIVDNNRLMERIEEEDNDSDDLNQILQKADEVIQQQEAADLLQPLDPILLKNEQEKKIISKKEVLFINKRAPALFQRVENKEQEKDHQDYEEFFQLVPPINYIDPNKDQMKELPSQPPLVCIEVKPLPLFQNLNNSGEFQNQDIEKNEQFIQLPQPKQENNLNLNNSNLELNEVNEEEKVSPVFEQISYQQEEEIEKEEKIEEDDLDEIDANQMARGADIEAEDLDRDRNFQKKKVLYSDKSESSVDEMMEDTPSNYNIPNGRLDGKSMGIKSILYQAKKAGLQIGNTPLNEKNSQLEVIKEMEKVNRTPNILQTQNRLGQMPKLQQEEERKFVNNLFKENTQQQTMPIQIGKQKIIDRNLSVPPRQQFNEGHGGFDSGNEASWRASNHPRGNVPFIVGGNDTAQTIHDLQNSQDNQLYMAPDLDEINEKKQKKKKVVNTQKKFKEPPPNVDRIKALESAYLQGASKYQEAPSSNTGRQYNEFNSGKQKNQSQPRAVLPNRVGGGYLDLDADQDQKNQNKLMKNNFV